MARGGRVTLTKAPSVGATMMLCDHVAVSEGKFYINGGAWATAGPGPTPMGIALLLQVPWDMTNKQIKFKLSLHFEDGEPVKVPGPVGQAPLEVGGEIEVGRPPGVREGIVFNAPIPINVGPIGLVPGRRYYWDLAINDQTDASWHLPFEWRAQPPAASTSDPTDLRPPNE